MNQFIFADQVREFMGVTSTSGRYSTGNLNSNIMAAQTFIERESGRFFAKRDATTFRFSSDGVAALAIPDLRTASAVSSNGSALTADESYWLIPDARYSDISVGIQTRHFDGSGDPYWFLSDPTWFDRNLDRPRRGGYGPDDLVITGDWGWDPLPYDVLHAVKALAAWYTKRADALLANAVANADGSVLDYSQLPPEVGDVIRTYKRGSQAVLIG